MTLGIYKLIFSNGAFYIGRSSNIEKRFSTHKNDLKNNKSNKKLLTVYQEVGSPTSYEILEVCDTVGTSIDREIYWIDYLKATTLGLNISPGGEDILQGELGTNSKYSNKEIESVLDMLILGTSLKEVAEILNISYNVVRDISAGKEHLWLKEMFPDKYKKLVDLRQIREDNSLANLTDKFRFKPKLSKYPTLVSPSGDLHSIENSLSAFARLHELNLGNLSSLINGNRATCQGWKVYRGNELSIFPQ